MKPGRNDPCPCGSGRKYKQCCGASSARRGRQCGSCTACCDGWLQIKIDGQDVYPGRPCPHSTGHSCRIYDRRPQDPCREFICGWLQAGSPLPEWFRPDRIGVMILRGKLTWRDLHVDVVVPAGQDPGPDVLAWMQRYAQTHSRPFLHQQEGEWHAFGPPEFQHEMKERLAGGEKLW